MTTRQLAPVTHHGGTGDAADLVVLKLPRHEAELLAEFAADYAAARRVWRWILWFASGLTGAAAFAYYLYGFWCSIRGNGSHSAPVR